MRWEIRGSPKPPPKRQAGACGAGGSAWVGILCLVPQHELSFHSAELLSMPTRTQLHLWPQTTRAQQHQSPGQGEGSAAKTTLPALACKRNFSQPRFSEHAVTVPPEDNFLERFGSQLLEQECRTPAEPSNPHGITDVLFRQKEEEKNKDSGKHPELPFPFKPRLFTLSWPVQH